MTEAAIGIQTGLALSGMLSAGVVVLVLVMTDMLGGCAAFVLAIAGDRRPGKLERRDDQKQKGQPTSHERSIAREIASQGKGLLIAPKAGNRTAIVFPTYHCQLEADWFKIGRQC